MTVSAVCAALGWKSGGKECVIPDSRDGSYGGYGSTLSYAPWVVDSRRLDCLQAIPLEDIPLVLAIGWDDQFVGLFERTVARPLSTEQLHYVSDVALRYLTRRLELGI